MCQDEEAMVRAGIVICLLLAGLVPHLAEAQCGASREASRQGEFARAELGRGECAKALKSAESALRLCPDEPAPYLLKAQAYECAGDYEQSAAVLRALTEVATGETATRAGRELERVLGVVAEERGVIRLPAGGAASSPLTTTLDPAPYLDRVARALDDGHCSLAVATAEELRRAQPSDPEGWGLLGDARKCAGDKRGAVAAYDEYSARGGEDRGKLEVRDQLRASLGALRVTLTDPPGDVIATFALLADDERIEPATTGPTDATFQDLPVGEVLELRVAGLGLETFSETLEPLAAGESRSRSVPTTYVGLGTLAVADYDAVSVGGVWVALGGRLQELDGGTEKRVTAGPIDVLVGAAPETAARIPLDVPRGETVSFDPAPYRPTRLTLRSVPAGSSVRVSVFGAGDVALARRVDLPAQVGEIDPVTGLRLAEPQRLTSLIGGEVGVFVRHPQLGDWQAGTVLQSGAANGLEVALSAFEGSAEIQAAWEVWNAQKKQAQGRLRGASIGSAVLGGVMLGSGLAALLGGSSLTSSVAGLDLHCGVLTERAAVEAEQVCADAARAASQQQAWLMGGTVGVGLGTVGLVVSGVFGARAVRVNPPSGPWEPWQEDEE